MADKKISALTAASTPLAGTEVLPIVQSGATVKVAVSDLTAGRGISATSVGAGVTTPAAGTTIEARNAAAGTAIRASNSGGGYIEIACESNATSNTQLNYTNQLTAAGGNFVLSNANFVVGTSGKGIDFSATSGSGTSELLADYEEGTWTPSIANSFNNYVHTIQVGRYTKVGNLVTVEFTLAWTTTNAGGFSFVIDGLPFTPVTLTNYASAGAIGVVNNLTNTNQIVCQVESATSQIKFYARVSGSTATALASSNWNTAGTANQVSGTITYQV